MLAAILATGLVFQQDVARRQMEESIAKQKASIQKQQGSTDFFTSGFFTAPPAGDCAAMPSSEVEPLIASAATAHGVEPGVIRAVIRQESAFRPCAVSPKGAMGLMQLMPATAEQFGIDDAFDPGGNVGAGARYLKQLLARFKGDLKLALAAYNAGPEKVDGKVPEIPETKNYVDQILKAIEGEKKDTEK